MIKINKRFNFVRWVFLCACVLLAAHPAWTQSVSSQPKLGAAPLKFVKNGINYQVVSFDDLYFNYQPPVDVEHPDGNITKAAKTPMPIPQQLQALNGKKVAIKGFVIPLANSEGQNVKEF